MMNVVPSIFPIVCSVNLEMFFSTSLPIHPPSNSVPGIVLIMDNDAVAHGMYLLITPLFLRKKKTNHYLHTLLVWAFWERF